MKSFQVMILYFAAAFLCSANTIVDVTFNGANPNGYNNGVDYVGPYSLTVNGDSVFAPCISFADSVYPGETWEATEVTFENSTPTVDFEEAWLSEQFNGNENQNAWVAIQQAMWDLTFSGSPLPFTDSATDTWLSEAEIESNWDTINGENFYLLVPVNGSENPSIDGTPQTFIVHDASVPEPLPEPATFILFGIGCVLIAGARKLRKS